ncbi:MAG TPA: ATP-dependent Clp protease proteolytic subunit [Pseudolabrys sp.]|jgi:ATP-dependent protease ClpP protease subunit|nr:ATP-dependent Clp protease proteolytic subunit [Pseudolabrys sp.]
MTKYLLSFNGPIQEKQTNALRDRIAQVLEQKDYQSLIVLFSSTGGRSTDGLSLYNFLRSLPRPIQFHAVGSIESMAVPVFCGAHKRTCSPITRFSFHTYSWGGFEGGQSYDRILEAAQKLKNEIDLSRKIVEDNTRIPADKLAALFRPTAEPTIFSAQEAKQFGLVEAVEEINPSGATQSDTVMWTVNWPSP